MAAKYILAALALIFLGVTLLGSAQGKATRGRAWLITGVIFGAVSAWLFYQG